MQVCACLSFLFVSLCKSIQCFVLLWGQAARKIGLEVTFGESQSFERGRKERRKTETEYVRVG